MPVAILILAAGSASRMGSIKQLLPYKKTTILEHVIDNALVSKGSNIYCVLGANSEAIKKSIQTKKVIFIDNPSWKNGLSSSIVAGIKHLQKQKDIVDAVLILLADQPHVDYNYINQLIALFENNPDQIVASKYSNINGVPAIFPFNTFEALLKLEGDKGAKSYLNNPNVEVITLELPFPHLFKDIDTQEDYDDLMRRS